MGNVWFQQGTTTASPAELVSFTFEILTDFAGDPGSSVYSDTLNPGDYTATPNAIFSHPYGQFYDIEFPMTPTSLPAGSYWISFYGIGATDFRTPNTGVGDGFLQEYLVGSASYLADPGNTPFRLETSLAPVPEPATLALFGLGALGLGAWSLRRRRRK